MQQARVYHVARGRMDVASGQAVLNTTVGNGYAVVVCLANGSGGIVHLDARMHEPSEPGRVQPLAWSALTAFLVRLRALGSVAGARAEIVGGADVLRILPMSMHEPFSQGCAAALVEFLVGQGVSVERVLVGGSVPRRVCLRLPGGEVGVNGTVPHAHASLPGARGSVTVQIGCMCVERSPTRLVTVLGSCVGVALYDPATRIGGLAHVMLPRSEGRAGQQSRFADTAVPALVAAMARAGALPGRLESKIAGGATMMFRDEPTQFRHIAHDNIVHVREALTRAKIPLLGEDVGGQAGRKMIVDLSTFGVRVTPLSAPGGA